VGSIELTSPGVLCRECLPVIDMLFLLSTALSDRWRHLLRWKLRRTMMAEPIGQLLQSGCETRSIVLRWRLFFAQLFSCARKLQWRSTCKNRWLISCKMDVQFCIAHLERTLRPPDQTGSFTILEKERSHYSSMYGRLLMRPGTRTRASVRTSLD